MPDFFEPFVKVYPMCEHLGSGSFAQVLPGETYEGAPLIRFECLPRAGVMAVSNQSVAIWCVRCFLTKKATV